MRTGATFHKWAALVWTVAGLPLCVVYAESMFQFCVLFWSLYANVVGHWGSYQAALAQEHIDHRGRDA